MILKIYWLNIHPTLKQKEDVTNSSKENEKNGFIARAIENWLTDTKERDYQAPYCQVLSHQGHKILYNSRYGPLEAGKDIVTVDTNGKY